MSSQAEITPVVHDQTWFHISSIQSAGLGLAMMVIGKQLAQTYTLSIAIGSILLGNLILWLIGMAMISMAFEGRWSAIQNARNYLGNWGALFMGLVLLISFLDWYVLETNFSVPTLAVYWNISEQSSIVRLGAGLGLLTALLAIGGIRLIKWFCVGALPFLIAYCIYAIAISDVAVKIDGLDLSVTAVIVVVLALLPGTINYATFFRHAKSKADGYLALTVLAVMSWFFQMATFWMDFTPNWALIYEGSHGLLFTIGTVGFALVSLVCINLVNIYFASACWESLAPRFEGAKGYAIIGLLGTAAYVFFQIYQPMRFVEDLANCYLSSLGVVLLIAFLVRIVVRHRPRPWEKAVNGVCWFVGCVVATPMLWMRPEDGVTPLMAGLAASGGLFLLIIFVEENLWAMRRLRRGTP